MNIENYTFTPTGLKIYLPIEYTFSLISRFNGKVSAFNFLKNIEGFVHVFNVLSWFIFLKAISNNYDFFEFVIYFILLYAFGAYITISNSKAFGGLVYLGRIYSYLSVFLAPQILMAIIAFYCSRLDLLFVTFLVKFILDVIFLDKFLDSYLYNTYLNYAVKYNLSELSINLSETEKKSTKFLIPLNGLIADYPELINRYTFLNRILKND